MKIVTLIAGLGIALGALGSTAEAVPAPPLAGQSGAAIEQIAFGCGPGFHPGAYGRCRPNRRFFRPSPAFRPPFRACPRGFHLGPAGRRCRPNF